MANTTNFNWETPDDTDLVKDGAAAIRTLGSAIDTSLVDLKGGTTGQILAKNTNADMDFVWVANDVGDITEVVASTPLTGGGTSGSVTVGIQDGTTAQKGAVQLENSTSSTSTTTAAVPASVKSAYDLANAAIPKSLVDAAGDLIYATANDTVARLGIGTAGQVLKVNSGATAPEWGAAGGASGLTFISRTTFSNVASVDINPFNDTYETYLMIIENISCATAADDVLIRGRYSTTTYTGAEYYAANAYIKFSSTAWTWANSSAATSFTLMPEADAAYPGQAALYFANVGDASKLLSMYGNWSTRSGMQGGYIAGEINSSQTWGGIRLLSSSSNITGEVSFYGLAKA